MKLNISNIFISKYKYFLFIMVILFTFNASAEFAVPTPLYPLGQNINVGTDITYKWQETSGATAYEFFIYDRNVPGIVYRNENISTSVCNSSGVCSFNPNGGGLPVGNLHVWRVRALYPEPSDFSYNAFNIIASPPTLTMNYSPNVITIGDSHTLTWSTTNATECHVTSGASRGISGIWPVKREFVGDGSSTYYCSGLGGGVSKVATYTIKPLDASEGITYPSTHESSVNITWSKVDNALTYVLEQTENDNNWLPIYTGSKNSFTVEDLVMEKSYRFRVKACYNTYCSEYTVGHEINPSLPTATAEYIPYSVNLGEEHTLKIRGYNVDSCRHSTNETPYIETYENGNFTKDWTTTRTQIGNGSSTIICNKNGIEVSALATYEIVPQNFQVSISVNGSTPTLYSSPQNQYVVNDIEITDVVEFSISSENVSTVCTLNGQKLSGGNTKTMLLRPAYLKEESIALYCQVNGSHVNLGSEILFTNVKDSTLKDKITTYISSIKSGPKSLLGTDYFGYRKTNYYSELHTLINLAQLYEQFEKNNEALGLSSDDYNKIEDYLLYTSEAFFEPCSDESYDISSKNQCRSQEYTQNTNGNYFVWKSPSSTSYHGKHWHYEWRAAAGISQALSALLKNKDRTACTSGIDEVTPSVLAINGTSKVCRAYNTARLLNQHIWNKWNDKPFVDILMGQNSTSGHDYTMTGTTVTWFNARNYITYKALIDMAFSPTDPGLLEKIDNNISESGNITCGTNSCSWGNFNLGNSSSDLSHSSDVMVALWVSGELNSYSSSFIHGLNNSTWNKTSNKIWKSGIGPGTQPTKLSEDSNGNILQGFARGMWLPESINTYGKFDFYANGFCAAQISGLSESGNFDLESEPEIISCETTTEILDLCKHAWYWETSGTNSCRWAGQKAHHFLNGWLHVGKYDRELMLKFRDTIMDEAKYSKGNINTSLLLPLYQTLHKN